MKLTLNTLETSLKHPWNTLEILLNHPWNTFEKPLKHPWNTFDTLLTHPWHTLDTPLMHSWNALKTLLKHYWNALETLLKHPWVSLLQMIWMLQSLNKKVTDRHTALVTLSLFELLIAAKISWVKQICGTAGTEWCRAQSTLIENWISCNRLF